MIRSKNTTNTTRLLGILGGLALLGGCAQSRGAKDPSGVHALGDEVRARPSSEAASGKLARRGRLDREALLREVAARNPSVESARQAHHAARARESRAEALPDPMLMYEFAPLSIGASDVPYGHTIRLSQTFPWPGKLSSRGDSARALAEASREDVDITKLDLALEASDLFDDYWLIARSLGVNAKHRKLLSELAASARAAYEVGRGSLQDPLQAEVEIAHLEHQEVVLTARRDAVRASLNALLHRSPEAPLPAPPEKLDVSEAAPAPSRRLQEQALARRGELRRAGARVRAAEASIDAADTEYYPDLTLSGTYTTMFMAPEHQWMLGVELPIPIQRGTRAGAVDEASAFAAQQRSELSREADAIRRDVDVARSRVVEAIHVVRLYRRRLLPVARDQIAASRSGYQTGANDFSSVIGAEKNSFDVELAYFSALAELSRRRARLSRALGELPGAGAEGGRP